MTEVAEQPPRRLVLACNLADRADYGETSFNKFVDEWFPRGMIIAHVSAWIGNRSRKYAAMVPFHEGMKDCLSEEFVKPMLKSAIVEALAENPNIVGPKGQLPQ